MTSFLDKIHPERTVTGFTKHDGTIAFFSFVKAILRGLDAKRVLDFGAGRGAWYHSSTGWKRELQDLRQYGAEVTACDVDPIVQEHPASDVQVVVTPGERLPFPDGHFDLIVSDVTFEHIEDPQFIAAELTRILSPGGYICARTPNKYGYAKILTGLTPNRWHAGLLRKIQPDRESQDVFPTFFRMNTVRAIRKHFRGCEVSWFRTSAEPAYYFGNSILYRLFLLTHKLLPDAWATSICFLIRKTG